MDEQINEATNELLAMKAGDKGYFAWHADGGLIVERRVDVFLVFRVPIYGGDDLFVDAYLTNADGISRLANLIINETWSPFTTPAVLLKRGGAI